MDVLQALLQTILSNFINPLVVIPAVALGWWGKSSKVLIVGAVLIAGLQLIFWIAAPLPAGAQRVLWSAPALLPAPMAIAFSVSAILKMQTSRSGRAAHGWVRLVLLVSGVVIGACAGGALFFVAALLVIEGLPMSAADGSRDYSLMVIGTPLGIFFGMAFGARRAWTRSNPTNAQPAKPDADANG